MKAARVSHRPVRREPVRLQPILYEAIEDVIESANAKAITLSFNGTEDITVLSKAYLLGLILINVLHNSVKYMPTGGKVCLALSANGVTITDSGLGLFIMRTLDHTLDIQVSLSVPPDHTGLVAKIPFPGVAS